MNNLTKTFREELDDYYYDVERLILDHYDELTKEQLIEEWYKLSDDFEKKLIDISKKLKERVR